MKIQIECVAGLADSVGGLGIVVVLGLQGHLGAVRHGVIPATEDIGACIPGFVREPWISRRLSQRLESSAKRPSISNGGEAVDHARGQRRAEHHTTLRDKWDRVDPYARSRGRS